MNVKVEFSKLNVDFLICKDFSLKVLLLWLSKVTDVCIQVRHVVCVQMAFTSHIVCIWYLACNQCFVLFFNEQLWSLTFSFTSFTQLHLNWLFVFGWHRPAVVRTATSTRRLQASSLGLESFGGKLKKFTPAQICRKSKDIHVRHYWELKIGHRSERGSMWLSLCVTLR